MFGDYISDYLIDQIQVREELLGDDNKSAETLKVLYQNTPWVRLRSGVNTAADGQSAFLPEAAKAYILEGGIRGREGIDLNSNTGLYSNTTQGIRPVPGITGVTIKNKDTWGCVREAEIKLKVWSVDDLEQIDLLYFRLGFTALLEWGNTIYITSKDNKLHYTGNEVECISDEQWFAEDRETDFNEIIRSKSRETEGNYDGMFGRVVNFSYNLQKDGSYDCTIKLISEGLTLFSMKSSTEGARLEHLDIFLKSFSRLSNAEMNTGESTIDDGFRPYETFSSKKIARTQSSLAFSGTAASGRTTTVSFITFDALKAVESYASRLQNTAGTDDKEIKSIKAMCNTVGNSIKVIQCSYDKISTAIRDSGLPLSRNQYIRLRDFIYIVLQIYNCNNKSSSIGFDYKSPLTYKTVPGMISLNPCISFIPPVDSNLSSEPAYISRGTESYNFTLSTDVGLQSTEEYLKEKFDVRNLYKNIQDQLTGEFDAFTEISESKGINKRNLLEIYVNVQYLIDAINSFKSTEEGLLNLFNSILSDVQKSLGNLNDFGVQIDDNTVYIVDRNNIPSAEYNGVKRVSVTGKKTTVTGLNVSSSVTTQMASELSIAAAASSTSDPKHALTSLLKLNSKVQDRHLKVEAEEVVDKLTEASRYKELSDKGDLLESTLKNYKIFFSASDSVYSELRESFKNSYGIWEELIREKLCQEYVSNDKEPIVTNLVPIRLELKLKGIGGFNVGSWFKVDSNLIPSAYNDWGNIITGVDHSIGQGIWETTLKTQYFPPKLQSS